MALGPALRMVGRWLMAASYVAVGVSHFTNPTFFLAIMPPYLPWHEELVALSGVAEIVGGVGVLFPATRRLAGWWIIALLIAVYPANIHMLINDVYPPGVEPNRLMLWLRMPVQFIFGLWALWACEIWPKPKRAAADPATR